MTAGTLARYAWASPVTMVGLAAASLARIGGGRVVVRGGIVEAPGGALARVLPRAGIGVAPAAMAVGHVMLAIDQSTLDRLREHEMVHVRQVERWGLLFPIAYAVASVAAALSGKHPYHDNRFEREASARSTAPHPLPHSRLGKTP